MIWDHFLKLYSKSLMNFCNVIFHLLLLLIQLLNNFWNCFVFKAFFNSASFISILFVRLYFLTLCHLSLSAFSKGSCAMLSSSVMSNSFETPWTVAHQAPMGVRPWDFSHKYTRMGCYFLLQDIFPTQGSNPHLCLQVDFLPTKPKGRVHVLFHFFEVVEVSVWKVLWFTGPILTR